MIKYIVDENALPSGAYQLHNATRGCTDIPNLKTKYSLATLQTVNLP